MTAEKRKAGIQRRGKVSKCRKREENKEQERKVNMMNE